MGAFDEYDFDVKNAKSSKDGYEGYDYNISNTSKSEPSVLTKVDDFVRALANGATFGVADKLAELLGGKNEKQLSKEAANRSPYSTLAGEVVGSALPSSRISKGLSAITTLSKPTVSSIAANQAATGGIMSVINQIGKDGSVDPVKVITDTGLSAAISVPITYLSRVISPIARIRAAGSELNDADRAAAVDFANKAKTNGIDLTVPEVVRQVSPGKSSGIDTAVSRVSTHNDGASVIRDFQGNRAPIVENVGKQLGSELNSASGANIQNAAKEGIKSAEDLVSNSASPYYQSAEKIRLPATLSTPGVKEATKQVLEDSVKLNEINRILGTKGPIPPKNSVAFQDAVVKQLSTNIANAEGAMNDPFRSGILIKSKQALLDIMDSAAPTYKTGRNIVESGNEMLVNPLKNGTLGKVAKTSNTNTQSEALFGRGVGSDVTVDEAINAAKRMGPVASEGVLANRIQSSVAKDPLGWGRTAVPTEGGMEVAKTAAGGKSDRVVDTLMAARAVDPTVPNIPNYGQSSPLATIWHGIRGIGSGKEAKMLMDNSNVSNLGKIGDIQRFFTTGASMLASQEKPVPEYIDDIILGKAKNRR